MAYSTISKPGLYFNTKLFEGNGSTQSLTGVGFQPDWVWFKNRDSSQNHRLFDAVRGAGKNIKSNADTAEIDAGTGTSGQLRTFDSDGFSVGSDGSVNNNNESIVAWNWKAGTTGSGTTGGSGTGQSYSYSVNTTSGFSIVTYSGNGTAGHTIPHHLGAVPRFIMVKATTRQDNWRLYHAGISDSDPETDEIYLDVTNAATDTDTAWYDTAPTSSVFTVGTNNGVNKSGDSYVAYCFAEKKGYSKFSHYTGNGNADGTFVYTGFSPAFVMTKRSDSTSDWLICDNKRPGYNVINKKLFPNLTQAEDSYDSFDFVSNGFKIRSSGSGHNASSGRFIYMAVAEEPLVANVGQSIPATAR